MISLWKFSIFLGLLIGPLLVIITNQTLKAYEASSSEEASQAIHDTKHWIHSWYVWSIIIGIIFVICGWVIGLQYELILILFVVAVFIVLVQTDLRMMILPNKVVLVGWLGVCIIRLAFFLDTFLWYLVSSILMLGLLWGVAIVGAKLLKREALGGGDVKLFALVGLAAGLELSLLTLMIASVLGLLYVLVMSAVHRERLKRYFAFGPFIALGCVICLLWGERWLSWYYSLL